jgi:hypothetical protein
MANNFGLNLTTAFKIYFDKSIKNYFLSPIGSEDESVLFVKLEKPFVKKLIIFQSKLL